MMSADDIGSRFACSIWKQRTYGRKPPSQPPSRRQQKGFTTEDTETTEKDLKPQMNADGDPSALGGARLICVHLRSSAVIFLPFFLCDLCALCGENFVSDGLGTTPLRRDAGTD
jgi:hypothetical protein